MTRLTKKTKRAIVELVERGTSPADIASSLGLPLVDVACVLADARAEAELVAAFDAPPPRAPANMMAIGIPHARSQRFSDPPPAGTTAYDEWCDEILASEGAL